MAVLARNSDHWHKFRWDQERLAAPLAALRHLQGKLAGRMEALPETFRAEATLVILVADITGAAGIAGELLPPESVRECAACRLGISPGRTLPAGRQVAGLVDWMIDATLNSGAVLTKERLFGWQAVLFPTGYSGMKKVRVGAWRDGIAGSGDKTTGLTGGKDQHYAIRVHYQAPAAVHPEEEMQKFLRWFNGGTGIDPVIKAGLAHFWFLSIHPFDDGNEEVAHAIMNMQLSRAEQGAGRFYSLSARIREERPAYYDILELVQQGTFDITRWLEWLIACLDRALKDADHALAGIRRAAAFYEKNTFARFNKRQQRMIRLLLSQPEEKVTTSKWAQIAGCSPDTALRDIQDLAARKILLREKAGGRSTNYRLSGISPE